MSAFWDGFEKQALSKELAHRAYTKAHQLTFDHAGKALRASAALATGKGGAPAEKFMAHHLAKAERRARQADTFHNYAIGKAKEQIHGAKLN